MITTVDALKQIYLQVGGSLTDTYSAIANGIPVGAYTTIPDVCEAISKVASGGSGLPEVSATDNGDILKVVGGVWAKADAELPAVTADDNGDILKVVSGEWAKANAELPSVNADDNGKLLGVSNGAWGIVSAPSPSGDDGMFTVILTCSGEGGALEVSSSDKISTEINNAGLVGKPVAIILRDSSNNFIGSVIGLGKGDMYQQFSGINGLFTYYDYDTDMGMYALYVYRVVYDRNGVSANTWTLIHVMTLIEGSSGGSNAEGGW